MGSKFKVLSSILLRALTLPIWSGNMIYIISSLASTNRLTIRVGHLIRHKKDPYNLVKKVHEEDVAINPSLK